jgi:methionyl-tRNA formyltransferase
LRLIYLGTPQFAVPTLEAILRAGHEVIEAITQPDRPKGRGNKLAMSPVKTCALAHGLAVFQPERVRRPEVLEHLRGLAPEIMVIVGYGQIIPQTVIDIAPRGIVNVHGSLLPHLRGAAPVQWSIVRGDVETGVTTMQIDAGLDTGDMLLKAATAIGENEDAVALAERLSHMGASLLVETLAGLELGTVVPQEQDNALATYAPILKKQDGLIDWKQPARAIHNLIRGMQPWPGAHTAFRGQQLQIWISHLVDHGADSLPGRLVFNRDGLLVGCGDGSLLKLIEVQQEGRKRMSAEDFARGQRVGENERLGD